MLLFDNSFDGCELALVGFVGDDVELVTCFSFEVADCCLVEKVSLSLGSDGDRFVVVGQRKCCFLAFSVDRFDEFVDHFPVGEYP